MIDLIPRPVSLNPLEGRFIFQEIPAMGGDGVFKAEMDAARSQFSSIGFPDSGPGTPGWIRCLSLDGPAGDKTDEYYRLSVGTGEITIKAAGGAGMYHGLQTLRQLFLSAAANGKQCIPCVEIEDWPRFPWRGLMLDCSRYFYSVPFIKKLIDVLSLHHISVFHWHLTDDQGWRLPIPAYPLLTEIGSRRFDKRRGRYLGGFYSHDEIREVVSFAGVRHVEVVPEIDLPGHAGSILAAYPGLGCTGGPYRVEDRFGIFEDVLCAGNDSIFDLAAAVFDTLGELFPSKYVHIGGDEVRFKRWEECPKCQNRLHETGLNEGRELQSWITVKLAGMLKERGKTAIGWDEVLEDSPRYGLPENVAVMSWRGVKGGIEAVRRGRQVIMSPNSSGCYLDYKHHDDLEEPGQLGISRISQLYALDPLAGMEGNARSLVLGAQANLWSELIYAGKIAEYMIFPRICALAEALWSGNAGPDDFLERLTGHRRRLDLLGLLQYRGEP
ncbi:MAG: beta-N-acetylhexosaminidase [Treponema sp.]|jgi:hexosaminidase|nr:beta-N-acetylhexosaminidase [Treponema sp.]